MTNLFSLARALARQMALSPSQRQAVERFATLIHQGLVGFGEATAAMLAAAGHPPLGSAGRCEIAWALCDAVENEAMRHAKAEAEARIAAWRARRAG